jgi:hypothetical protein
MVKITENPFSRLDNAEIESDAKFVELFSDISVKSCLELYKPGNVIIYGIEGSGKSMLLNLLKPEIRIKYHETKHKFPIPKKFLGAGINFTRSSLMDIGARIVSRLEFGDSRQKDAPFYFGDFINYWVVRDIIKSIMTFKEKLIDDNDLLDIAGLDCSVEKEAMFVRFLSESPAWSSSLNGVQTIDELRDRLSERINKYRHIAIARHPESIPETIGKTLTEIGEPISQTTDALYKSGMLEPEIPVLIRFDQYEDLYDAVDFDVNVAEQYRQIVNKFLWTRDRNVSFKIGSRPYALSGLSEGLKIFGLGSQVLEPQRHYIPLDLDERLRRPEDRSMWIFDKLAEDVFTRRLKSEKYPEKKIAEFFGSTMSPYKKAQMVVNNENARERALGTLTDIPESYAKFLVDLAIGNEPASGYGCVRDEKDAGDLLSARLGVAWFLQKGKFGLPPDQPLVDGVQRWTLPWNERKAMWWKKERINQALLQISSSAGQRMHWSGKEDILTLSGSNILIFLNICGEIWKIWEQAQKVKGDTDTKLDFGQKPVVDPKYQSAGIYAASSLWYNKVVARTKGDSRKRLIDKIGNEFSNKLRLDIKMSYPGHNGFSLTVSDYEKSEVKHTLMKAVRYGDLIEFPHTPKNKSQGRRRKWYLLPILSPALGLTASHTKEPYYMDAKTIEKWISDSQKPNKNDLMQ